MAATSQLIPGRVLATATAKPGQPVTTTIDPKIQAATANAIGGIAGGAVVLDAKNGNVLAMAGSAYSAPAPPGSTFKIITTTAALESHAVKLSDTFPLADHSSVGGRDIGNSNGEICGGTFVQAFAASCNSVFAPLGPKIGGQKMVDTAQKYGFNSPPEFYSPDLTASLDLPKSSIPTSIGTDLDLGVTAIGQGRLLATPLEMASVAQTIAAGGMRSPTAIATDPGLAPDAKPVRVTDANTAGIIKNLMIDVVNNGTGTQADLGRIQVAGKTGTAELGPKPKQPPAKPLAPARPPRSPSRSSTPGSPASPRPTSRRSWSRRSSQTRPATAARSRRRSRARFSPRRSRRPGNRRPHRSAPWRHRRRRADRRSSRAAATAASAITEITAPTARRRHQGTPATSGPLRSKAAAP